MNNFTDKKQKAIAYGILIFVTVLPIIAFVGLLVTLAMTQNNILSWME